MNEPKIIYIINKLITVTYQLTTEKRNEIKGTITCFKKILFVYIRRYETVS